MKIDLLVTQYMAIKKSMGNECNSMEKILKVFIRVIGNNVDIVEINREQVNCFLATTTQGTAYWQHKYSALNCLFKYAISRGYIVSSPLPITIPKTPQPFVPYIYTHEELRRLLDATTTYCKNPCRVEPHTFRTILLLLYGAGLRRCEVLSLTLKDVNLPEAVLTIRNTKFNKTRLVPLGSQLNEVMIQYQTKRKKDRHSQSEDAPFFVGRNSKRIPIGAINRLFALLRTHADVCRTDNAKYQPRLQDLRHSFAVHRLIEWYQQGKDVQKLLPKLSTYLGHVCISHTQVYLTMTPELLQEASRRFEQYMLKEAYNG